MIVKCISLSGGKFTDNYSESLHVGYHYNVLEISYDYPNNTYRIIPDDIGFLTPILVSANNFEIVSSKVPENWLTTELNGHKCSGPQKWLTFDGWDEGFFPDYFNDIPGAIVCFKEELMNILSFDQEYAQLILEERINVGLFSSWNTNVKQFFLQAIVNKMLSYNPRLFDHYAFIGNKILATYYAPEYESKSLDIWIAGAKLSDGKLLSFVSFLLKDWNDFSISIFNPTTVKYENMKILKTMKYQIYIKL